MCQYVHCYQNPIKHRISTITWLLIFGYLQNPYFWVMWLPTCIDADIFLHPSSFFILCVRYLDKPWHSKRLTKTDVSNKVDSKGASAHLCRLICDGLGLCMHNRDVLAGDFAAKGVGDIRNGERFRLHHRRLWEGSRHSGEWAENRFSHYINFTSHRKRFSLVRLWMVGWKKKKRRKTNGLEQVQNIATSMISYVLYHPFQSNHFL